MSLIFKIINRSFSEATHCIRGSVCIFDDYDNDICT